MQKKLFQNDLITNNYSHLNFLFRTVPCFHLQLQFRVYYETEHQNEAGKIWLDCVADDVDMNLNKIPRN